MKTPQYIKDAQNKYNSKFDLIQLKLPKGTKELIKNIMAEDESMTAFCVSAVLEKIQSRQLQEEQEQVKPSEQSQTHKATYKDPEFICDEYGNSYAQEYGDELPFE